MRSSFCACGSICGIRSALATGGNDAGAWSCVGSSHDLAGVAMGRPQEQGPEDQHVEGTLHECDAVGVRSRHVIVEILLSSRRAGEATVSQLP